MKTTISCFLFLFLITGVTAQEIKIKDTRDKIDTNIDISLSQENLKSGSNISFEEDVCYAELSKTAFYEALIRQNKFKIDLKKNNTIALKNTEDIIANSKKRISYSE